MTDANTCLRWLKRDQPDVDEAIEATSRIVKDGTRATEIIDRLRSLYKKSPPQREFVDVNEVVREMLLLLRGEANRYAISMRMELAPDLPKITGDRVQLQQVLMNLMLNAIEAMKDTAGELTIKTEMGQGGPVLISVSDTGVGLPNEKMEQIFNAFFTTKPQGSGNGVIDQPFHCGIAWRPFVGDGQLRTGRDILLHRANSSGGSESARQAGVISASITAQGFMSFGEASSQR